MRPELLLVATLIGACASPQMRLPIEVGDLALTISRTTFEDRAALVVLMTNQSQAEVCVRAELLQNPYTYEIDLNLRRADGRAVKQHQPGFLPPPNVAPIRVAPGRSVQGRYYIDSRFKLKDAAKNLREGMSAKASFRYDACDGSQSRQAVSTWQRV